MSDAGADRPPASVRWRGPALALAVLVATLAVYGRGLSGGFVYDDHRLVEQNALLHDLARAPEAFRQDLAGGAGWKIYRPLPALSFMIDLALWGARPLGFHLVGVLWHLVAVGALAWLAHELRVVHGRCRSSGAARGWYVVPPVAALLFALHPINSEAVIWICRRADVMAGASILTAVAAFLRWRRTDRSRWAVVTGAFTMVALLSKEIGVVVPPLLLLLALLPAPRALPVGRWRAVGLAVLLGLSLPLYAWWRVHLFGSAAGQPVGFVQNWVVHLEGPTRIWTQLALLGHYLRLLLLPRVLSADYSWRSIPPASGPGDPMVWLGILGVAGTVLIGAWAWRRYPALAFALGLEAVAFLPISNWIVPIGTAFAERLFYVPAAGFVIAVALAVGEVQIPTSARRLRVSAAGALLIILVLLGVRTTSRTADWQNDDTLFAAVLSHYPDNVVARVYAAIGAGTGGDPETARAHYRHALEVYPDYHLARVNLALVLLERGDPEGAAREARWVIARDPGPGAAHLTLGRALLALGDAGGAERELERAVADPRTRIDGLLGLAGIYLERGDRAAVVGVIELAERVAPDHPEVLALRRRLSRLP